MAKAKQIYICEDCGNEHTGWMGKCSFCGAWNSLVEVTRIVKPEKKTKSQSWIDTKSDLIDLDSVSHESEPRLKTHSEELDRVLGGGFVRSTLLLLGGDPGIGKSTLLLQMCKAISKDLVILYVCGEESPEQIKLRANRLSVSGANILLFPETQFDRIYETIQKVKPDFLIIDSIQTIYDPDISGAAGSITQIKENTARFLQLTKASSLITILVGHMTKEGSLAGPRILEHMVDTVLQFEGERGGQLRILRSIKNRFGTTHEIGLFEMSETGLQTVSNPSQLFLSGSPQKVPGSGITTIIEGTRPLMIEIQTLLIQTVFNFPQRMTQGLDKNRISMLIAVCEKIFRLNLNSLDAYINVIGGIKTTDTATDLAIIATLISSQKNIPIQSGYVLFGEVGLTGEIRPIRDCISRLKEAKKMGFEKAILPSGNKKYLKSVKLSDLPDLVFIDHINQAMDIIFI